MEKILFVCLGNICRSPLAEGILRHQAKQQGLHLYVDSAGTGHWHAGEHPDERAIQIAKENGIDISKHVARKITKDDLENFDRILVADAEVYDAIVQMAASPERKKKIDYIMNFANPGLNLPVPDPYYGGMNGFKNVFQMLDNACRQIIVSLQKK